MPAIGHALGLPFNKKKGRRVPFSSTLIQRNKGVDGTLEVVDTLNEAFVDRAEYVQSNCLYFDGSSVVSVTCGIDAAQALSVTGWGLLTALDANEYVFRSDDLNILLLTGSNRIYFRSKTSGADAIAVGTPYFFVATLNETGVVNIYVDGLQSGVADQQSTPANAASICRVGASDSVGTAGVHGYLSDFRLYERVLSASEALDLYNGKDVGSYFGIPMSDGAGLTAHNTSGLDYHGAIKGASWATKDFARPTNLNIGFSLYEHATLDPLRIPFTIWGTPITSPIIPTGYTLTKHVEGCASSGAVHNGAETKILGTDAQMLACSLYSPDGLTFTAFSFADAQAFVSGTDNHWLKWGLGKYGSCMLVEDNQYAFDLEYTVAMYNRFVAFYKQGTCGGGVLVPYEVTEGGIGPDGTFFEAEGGTIILVEDS